MALKNTIQKSKYRQKFRYIDLIRELAITDFKIKYQGSLLGYAWSLAKPLAMFGVLYLVFTVFVRIGSTIPHYALYLLLGIVLWTYFSDTTNTAMRSIADKGDMMRKVYFPRIVIIISASISSAITLLLNMLIVVVFMIFARLTPTVGIIPFVFLLLEMYILCLGVSFLLSAMFVKFRDIGHIWEVMLQLLFYASAIIYPLSIVPVRFQKFILLSPITQIIQDARYVLISTDSIVAKDVLAFPFVLIPYVIPVVLVIIGYIYFVRSAKNFAEES